MARWPDGFACYEDYESQVHAREAGKVGDFIQVELGDHLIQDCS